MVVAEEAALGAMVAKVVEDMEEEAVLVVSSNLDNAWIFP